MLKFGITPKLVAFSNYRFSPHGLSGGDRIFFELLKDWSRRFHLTLIGNSPTLQAARKYPLRHLKTITIPSVEIIKSYNPFFLFLHTVYRLFSGIKFVLRRRRDFKNTDYFYSASDFLPDSLPSLLVKFLFPKIKLISSFYLFAPSPFSSPNPYSSSLSGRIINFFYWFIQFFTFPVIAYFSDFVLVTSRPDQQRFRRSVFNRAKIIVVRGGVDYIPTDNQIKKSSPAAKRKYSAVFLGRLHQQKGVLELIDIWAIVVKTLPDAKLAIIGDGPLKNQLLQKIKHQKLSSSVRLFGFKNGRSKHRLFCQSRIVVHPATYDSGGMAAAEAMAWGLPGVSFDLPALKTYYPQGMIKTPCFDHQKFADNVITLLSDRSAYAKLSRQARELIVQHWPWSKRAALVYSQVVK